MKLDTVKDSAQKSKRHRSTQESMKAFLGRHPLPKPLKPFRAAIEKFPDFPTVAQIIIDLVTAGLTDAEIGQALEQIAEQIQPGAHRCAACLSWTEEGVTGAFIHSGITHALTFCPQCTALASTGRHTEAMTRNLIAYIQSEVKP